MKALDIKNLPSPKEESWKYTNLKRALNDDLAPLDGDSFVIHKARGEISEQIEEVLFTASGNVHTKPTFEIVLEDGAELTIVEHQDGEGAYWKNMTTTIRLGKNAKLNHVRIQNDDKSAVNTNMVHIELDRDAVYDAFTLNTGGKMTRHEIHAVINGENAELSLNGINLLGAGQHGDTTILIEHKAPHCQSNQFYRTILDDDARGVFQGKVHVHKPAQKTDGYQLSNAILLSDKAEMDTKPELEIYADDVKCSHGATTGQLDEEPVFYLRSRGLTEKQARELLIQAFVDEVVDKVADEALQGSIRQTTGKWLQDTL